jgi:glycerophosphoryl diester phosphodiesterase
MMDMPPVVIAHRGASLYAPEHTVAAYDLAQAMGADYLEQDVQLTADGALVVLHDETLDRTARGPVHSCTGPVRERTLAQLRECDFGSWFNDSFPDRARPEFVGAGILTLEEVLERYAGAVGLYIETKNPGDGPGMEEELVALLARHGLTGDDARDGRVILQSFSRASLRRVHELDPRIPLVQLYRRRMPSWLVQLRIRGVERYAVGIGPSRVRTSARLVRAAHGRGLLVHPYTVNDSTDMRELLELGANGLFTDAPDVMLRVLGREPGAKQEPGASRSTDLPGSR